MMLKSALFTEDKTGMHIFVQYNIEATLVKQKLQT